MSRTFDERPWFWEGHVQNSLAAHLARQGWDIQEMADTDSKAPGIDLVATRDDRLLADTDDRALTAISGRASMPVRDGA